MQPRDVFDGLLLAFAAVAVYLELAGVTFRGERFATVLAVLTGMDTAVYIVVGGVFALVFLAFMVVYLPWRQSQRSTQ